MTGKRWVSWRSAGLAALALVVLTTIAGAAQAQTAHPWQLGFQEGVSPMKERIADLHNLLLVMITLITLFVLGLMVYVIVKFNAKKNPVPSRTSHNTLIEVLWTVVPVLILVIIAIPSFRLLYYVDRTQNADMTLKVTGHQWYWSYEYPDNGNFTYDSYMVQPADLKPGQYRLLEVDNRLVVPVGATVRVLVTSTDVMHSWYLPAVGVQIYAVPGRINETWLRIDKAGVYFGQCNQICGVNHAFMPIAIEAMPKAEFDRWAAQAKTKFAQSDVPPNGGAGAPQDLRLAAARAE
jgi:cytochrome c oxidase subunit 2